MAEAIEIFLMFFGFVSCCVLISVIIAAVQLWRKDPEREWDRKWKAIKKAERERKRLKK